MTFLRVVVCLFIVTSLAHAEEAKSRLDELRWMLGEWEQAKGDKTISEHWTSTSAGLFTGQGSTRRNGATKSVATESLLIAQMGEDVFYIAKTPQNQFPIPFRLVKSDGQIARFENRSHDFPRVIEYRKAADDQMTVNVTDGKGKGFALKFRRKPTD